MIAQDLWLWLVKGSVFLALSFPVAALLRKEPSSARHLVWTCGLVLALGVPFVSVGLPRWQVEVPSAIHEMTAQVRRPMATLGADGALGAGAPQAVEADPAPTVATSPNVGVDALSSASGPSPDSRDAARTSRRDVAPTLATGPAPSESRIWTQFSFLRLLFVAWAAVADLFVLRLVASMIRVRHLLRQATPVRDASWNRLRLELSDRLGLARAPELRTSAAVSLPMTCGILRPVVLLPAATAPSWPEDRRKSVLFHEFAHVRRRDLISHLVGHLACALYWFQPLAWSAARRMRAEGERSCDDLVLRLGTRASVYADHLLQIATAGRSSVAPMAAVPMAHPREFERRLLAILSPEARREPLGSSRVAALVVAVVLCAAPLMALVPTTPDAAVAPTLPIAVASPAPQDLAWPPKGMVGSSLDAQIEAIVDSAEAMAAHAEQMAIAEQQAAIAEQLSLQGPQDPQGPQNPQDFGPGKFDYDYDFDFDFDLDFKGDWRGAWPFTRGAPQDPAATLEARSGLVGALGDSAASVRRMSAWALARFAPDSVVVRALAATLRSDTDPSVREMSAWALGQHDDEDVDPIGIDALAAAVVQDGDPSVRAMAAWALGQLEPEEAPAALDALEQSLAADQDEGVRDMAAWALGRIGIAPVPAGLLAAISDPSPEVREMVVWAIGQIRDPESLPALTQALGDEDEDVRSGALWAIGRMSDEPAAISALTAALQDPDETVRRAAAEALGGARGNWWDNSGVDVRVRPRPNPRPLPNPPLPPNP